MIMLWFLLYIVVAGVLYGVAKYDEFTDDSEALILSTLWLPFIVAVAIAVCMRAPFMVGEYASKFTRRKK